MHELLPIASGLVLGTSLSLVRPRLRAAAGVAASAALGVVATVVSGEYRIGWEFLLIDVPLVALCAAASAATVRARMRERAER